MVLFVIKVILQDLSIRICCMKKHYQPMVDMSLPHLIVVFKKR